MSFPTFEASFLAARQGRQSRAHHRCFPNSVNRSVTKPRPHPFRYPLSPTDCAQEPFFRSRHKAAPTRQEPGFCGDSVARHCVTPRACRTQCGATAGRSLIL